MVIFKDHEGCLVILSAENEPINNGLSIPMEEAAFGRLASPLKFINPVGLKEWSTRPTKASPSFPEIRSLRSYLHDENSSDEKFITLGSRIISGDTYWGNTFRILGEFSYIPKYWEWAEDILYRCRSLLVTSEIEDAIYASLYSYDCNKDVIRAFCENWCPATNTLHIASGEASISLWDLHTLGGLPIHGFHYDEAVPSVKELTGIGDKGRFIPKSCEHLFSAFYHISKSKNDGKVKIEDWINFWFRDKIVYPKPPVRKVKKLLVQNLLITHPDLFGSVKIGFQW